MIADTEQYLANCLALLLEKPQQEWNWSGGRVLATRNGGEASLQAVLFFGRESDDPRPAYGV